MTTEDILTLARAGFSAQQIGALSKIAVQPAPQPQLAPDAIKPSPDQDLLQQLLGKVETLNTTVERAAIQQTQQPPMETVDDILASIINPKE